MRLFLLAVVAVCSQAADFDILIRNARVVDGTGNPWFHADVGLRGDRIAAIGRLAGMTAGKIVEADRRGDEYVLNGRRALGYKKPRTIHLPLTVRKCPIRN